MYKKHYGEKVMINSKYTKENGAGIWEPVVAGGELRTDTDAALYNGGWNKRRIADGISYENRRDVTIFKGDVPEFGTYLVEFSITAVKSDIENMTLFAGRRNMIDREIWVKRGETYTKSFYQAVFPYIPALSSERRNAKEIFVSWTGIEAANEIKVDVTIKKKAVPVIWVAGDSTLTDQNAGIPYYPYGSCAGWAQMLAMYVSEAAVCNLSHSGMTSNCFRDDGHYDIVREFMKAGDLFIIQFGHNDQKRRNLLPFGGYFDNLVRFTGEVREKGATPIICSPISRIPLKVTEAEAKELDMPCNYSLLTEYAQASREVATKERVPFVDLHGESMERWIQLGEDARDYFIKGDITHTNEYGAAMIVDIFVKTIRNADSFANNIFTEGKEPFTPDSDTKELPKENPGPGLFDIDPPYVDIKGIPEYEGIHKAFKYCLLDPCVMYLHPYDEMPRGQVLMVMFGAFRMPGIRPYKKKFADVKADEWISGYVEALTQKNLIDPRTIATKDGKEYFRPDDALTYRELASFLMRNLYDTNISLEEAFAKSVSLGIFKKQGAEPKSHINRAEVYTALSRYMDIAGGTADELPSDAEVHPVH
jgi:lysophospholipase L1-like esterase